MYIVFFSQIRPANPEKHYLTARRGRKLSAAYTTQQYEAARFATEAEAEAEARRRIDRDALPFMPRGAFGFCCFVPQAE